MPVEKRAWKNTHVFVDVTKKFVFLYLKKMSSKKICEQVLIIIIYFIACVKYQITLYSHKFFSEISQTNKREFCRIQI